MSDSHKDKFSHGSEYSKSEKLERSQTSNALNKRDLTCGSRKALIFTTILFNSLQMSDRPEGEESSADVCIMCKYKYCIKVSPPAC